MSEHRQTPRGPMGRGHMSTERAKDFKGALLKLLRGLAVIDAASLLIWTGIYCLFALVGVLIAGLLHFALKKEG